MPLVHRGGGGRRPVTAPPVSPGRARAGEPHVRPLGVLTIILLSLASIPAGQAAQTFTGTISDDMCALAGHASMRMGPTDADCVRACVTAHGASYVLVNGKDVYTLSDQQTPERLAGQRVKVVGTLDAKTKTIRVESMAPDR